MIFLSPAKRVEGGERRGITGNEEKERSSPEVRGERFGAPAKGTRRRRVAWGRRQGGRALLLSEPSFFGRVFISGHGRRGKLGN